MRLTKKKAWEICIELWTWAAKTGLPKCEWPEWVKYEEMRAHCPFCEYSKRMSKRQGHVACHWCPISCFGMAFQDWERAETLQDRKYFAAQFLGQLKAL